MGFAVPYWRQRLNQEIEHSWTDVILLLCYTVTGLLDGASTQVWGAFVSMQTGNTVYVGLGVASIAYQPVDTRLFRLGLSLLSFCIGVFLFSHFHRHFSPRRRWVLCASFLAQTTLTAIAAFIVTFMPSHEDSTAVGWDVRVLLPLVLISLQSSGQAIACRALKYTGLTSVVLTSVYCDLFSDPGLFATRNVGRNRRAVAPLLLLVGAVGGGFFVHSSVGMMGALWLATFMKSMMAVSWLLWPAEKEELV